MASDSEEIEYQSLDPRQSRPLLSSVAFQHEEDEDDIHFREEHGFTVHMSPDGNKSQWNHVDDLDKFFVNVYDYHQRHGFFNMVLSETFQLLQFVFIVVFATYMGWCVNYPELFDEIPHNTTHKKTFDDITLPIGICIAKFDFWTWLLLVLSFLFFIGRSIKMMVNLSNYMRTRNFFISALNIETRELSNMTWHEVQTRLLEVQKEEQICIHKQELTHLDIYHRILRFKNYLVAMANKNLLPLKVHIPVVGECALLTHGMRFNLDCLLYWSPWSIFLNSYTMRDEYRSHHKRKHLADHLALHITGLAVLNLVLCPFIFFYQIIYFFLRYTESIKRSPSFLGSRQWANYGRLYLRHFNELDHELAARLNRAYVPSKMYMNSFQSQSLIIVAKYFAFFSGAIVTVILILGIMDFNDVTKVEHVFAVASIAGLVATVSSGLVPDENEVFCPEKLMMSILAHIHYMPDQWKGKAHTSKVRDEFSMLFQYKLGKAHTSKVRDEFSMLFQYKLIYILEELFSPLITPFWLFFGLRPKALQIVDFFRSFTIDVAGVGDVCSFAQMDIKRHGNPQWTNTKPSGDISSRSQQAENGKTELSLMHFTTTNPEWRPPQESNNFITEVKQEARRELPLLTSMMADPTSLPSLEFINPVPFMSFGGSQHPQFGASQHPQFGASQHPQFVGSHHQNFGFTPERPGVGCSQMSSPSLKLRGGLSQVDGPVGTSSNMLQSTMTTSSSFHTGNYGLTMADESQRALLYSNMSLSVLLMHEAHHRQRKGAQVFFQSSSENSPVPSTHFPHSTASSIPQQRTDYSSESQHDRPQLFAGGRASAYNFIPSSDEPSDSIYSPAGAGLQQADPLQHHTEVTGLRQGLSSYTAAPQRYGAAELSADVQTHPRGRHLYYDEDSEPLSMPPLPLPPNISSTGTVSASVREGTEPMPQIKEDMSGEHEIDTTNP